jgi:hypothetical protein
MGMTNGNTPLKTETKPKRKTPADIAKAAEAKRRKIEEEDRDPAADDDDDGRPNIKAEPGTNPYIKQEPGMGGYLPGYNTMPSFQGYATYGMPAQYPIATNAFGQTGNPNHLSANIGFPLFTQSAGPQPTSTVDGYSASPPASLSEPRIKQDPDQAPTQSLQSQPPTVPTSEDESVFRDFCNSELYMAPMLRKSPTPPASPDHSSTADPAVNAVVARRASSVVEVVPAPTPTAQPECIVLD